MAEALEAPVESVGGKAASLARLHAADIPVPPFFVVEAGALRELLEAGPGGHLRPELASAVLEGYHGLGHAAVAVRSSAAGEDSAAASFAGQFASILGVSGDENLLLAVERVCASALSDDVEAYRRSSGVEAGAFAVVVQAQIFSEKAGVLFTRHPLEPDGHEGYLEANFGTGESVVGGMVTPDSLTFTRAGGKVVSRTIGSKRVATVVDESGSAVIPTPPERRELPVLSDEEAEAVVARGLRIEELFSCPQDVEWAFDSAGLWILQARPQTGLAS
ncbi:MAG TPA: PEP/pyruvate-binding domain-containing protein [Actinomycetota bacterium]|nr:PEP/pyruvate-binding domain-containing protein [Actinomycetota bacterium]